MPLVEFPLSSLKGESGLIPEPIIPVGIVTRHGLRLYDFLVDSGADMTVLPFSLAHQVGISIKDCIKSKTQGVEGKGTTIYHAEITIKIDHWEDRIRCAFASHDLIPPLLGRLDVFSKYNITFHAKRESIIFQKI